MTDENDLLKLAAKGNETAFLTLYQRHQGPLFRFALHMSGRVETAEEIVQEVFLLLLSPANGFAAGNGSLQGYLIGTARNMIRGRLRQARRSVEMEPVIVADLLDALSKEQELRDLHTAILSLPPNYREVVALCDLEGLDYSQAASHLGCPLGTVRSRLHRARAILAAKLQKRVRRNGDVLLCPRQQNLQPSKVSLSGQSCPSPLRRKG